MIKIKNFGVFEMMLLKFFFAFKNHIAYICLNVHKNTMFLPHLKEIWNILLKIHKKIPVFYLTIVFTNYKYCGIIFSY